MSPDARRRGWTRLTSDGAVMLVETAAGELVVTFARTAGLDARGSAAPEYRVVLLASDGEEVTARGRSTTANASMALEKLAFDAASTEIASVGLAVLDLEGRREVSERARSEAARAGASVLPLPVIGEPLPFDLPAISGERLRSEDLRGRVVLIDCWATWCGPCMEKMPSLKTLHARHGGDGLVVIGINFDEDREAAARAVETHELAWPHVSAVETAGDVPNLWERATGIRFIPRLLLIDRDGVLIDDFYPHDLEGRLAEVMGP